ncbi:putative feruloyl esterase B-2 [Flagelloscypha sp. PMI_526]|nr:putative feruloyl esterase B-2 [Flagelloscypha sp. PMI_526]
MEALLRLLPASLQAFLQLGPSPIDLSVFPTHCTSFASRIEIPHVTVNFAEYLANGTVLPLPENHPTCRTPEQVVQADLCRISLSVATSNSSEITMEAWLPHKYTGRLLTVGNRGLSGCIIYSEISMGASLGFATIGANNGQNGTSGEAFLNNPEVMEDYTSRSLHTANTIGKVLYNQFYHSPHRKSYYYGCSCGGRQGFHSARYFPGDFDGIIAGAPLIKFKALTAWGALFYNRTGPPGSDSFLNAGDWALVHDETLRQCDGIDGAMDGLLADPDQCNFVPELLICRNGQTHGCLTGRQVQTVRDVFSPVHRSNGELIYPAMQYGINTKDSVSYYLSGTPWNLTSNWGRYAIYGNPKWDPTTFTQADVDKWQSHPLETWEGDLSAFEAKGGKLISFHGLQDSLVSSHISTLYYSHVSKTMSKHPADLDAFYRLFMVAGMDHCSNGPGYSNFGQDLKFMVGREAGSHILMDLVSWVEKGKAPDVLMGAKRNEEGEVVGWKPHCRWPEKSRFVGGKWVCLTANDAAALAVKTDGHVSSEFKKLTNDL